MAGRRGRAFLACDTCRWIPPSVFRVACASAHRRSPLRQFTARAPSLPRAFPAPLCTFPGFISPAPQINENFVIHFLFQFPIPPFHSSFALCLFRWPHKPQGIRPVRHIQSPWAAQPHSHATNQSRICCRSLPVSCFFFLHTLPRPFRCQQPRDSPQDSTLFLRATALPRLHMSPLRLL